MSDRFIDPCEHCGADLPVYDNERIGRPRKYCDNRCRQAHFRAVRKVDDVSLRKVVDV